MERFLFRLSQSEHANRFILKGALMLAVWHARDLRPTGDIDLLGKARNEDAVIIAQSRDILRVDVQPDGLAFDPTSLRTEPITGSTEHEGLRIRFLGALGTARIHMQIGVGFGDAVYPEPEPADFPTMLEFPAPRLLCYSRESTIAEKLEAIVRLGQLNSRMKDFYDIWLLSRQFEFSGPELTEAIRLTFERRRTAIPVVIEEFSLPFVDVKQTQRAAFRNGLQQDHVPASLADIAVSISEFLSPIVAAAASGAPGPTRWTLPASWT